MAPEDDALTPADPAAAFDRERECYGLPYCKGYKTGIHTMPCDEYKLALDCLSAANAPKLDHVEIRRIASEFCRLARIELEEDASLYRVTMH